MKSRFKKYLSALTIILLFVLGGSENAFAKVKFSVTYSLAANTFGIMDQVSNWWEGFCEEEYQNYWRSKYGMTDEDQKLFSQYKKLREKYYDYTDQRGVDLATSRNGFFATLGSLTEDPIAIAFYSSRSLDTAYSKLQKIVAAEDINFLRAFHEHFQKQLEPLLLESDAFRTVISKLNKRLNRPGLSKLFEETERFFNVRADIEYQVILVWCPPSKRNMAFPVGDFLVFQYNPIKHLSELESDADIVFHEVVHTISARQELSQKQMVTKQFLAACEIEGKLKKKQYLEEPLAVAIGQIMYLERIEPSKLDYAGNLYNDFWIGPFGKLIYPLVQEYFRTKKSIADGFGVAAGRLCKEQLNLAQKLAEKK